MTDWHCIMVMVVVAPDSSYCCSRWTQGAAVGIVVVVTQLCLPQPDTVVVTHALTTATAPANDDAAAATHTHTQRG